MATSLYAAQHQPRESSNLQQRGASGVSQGASCAAAPVLVHGGEGPRVLLVMACWRSMARRGARARARVVRLRPADKRAVGEELGGHIGVVEVVVLDLVALAARLVVDVRVVAPARARVSHVRVRVFGTRDRHRACTKHKVLVPAAGSSLRRVSLLRTAHSASSQSALAHNPSQIVTRAQHGTCSRATRAGCAA